MAAQSRAIPIILTRPAEQGARFAKDMRAHFGGAVTVIESPLLAPRFLQPTLPQEHWTAVIFTSATAVTATGLFRPDNVGLPPKAYCVGDRTAAAAAAMGFTAISAKGNADTLCAMIQASGEPGPLLHLRGKDVVGHVAERLVFAGIETHEAIVYAEMPQIMTTTARVILSAGLPVILPVFSPRTGEILTQEVAKVSAPAPLVTVAISSATEMSLTGIPSKARFVAEHPDAPSMLVAIGRALIAAQAA